MRENPPGGLTCRSVNKKGIYILEKFSLYFTHLPRSPQWTDLHEILHGGSSRRHNHLFQILCRSVEVFRICAGSNFAILHWLSRSPLTQGCATARLWCRLDLLAFYNLTPLSEFFRVFLERSLVWSVTKWYPKNAQFIVTSLASNFCMGYGFRP